MTEQTEKKLTLGEKIAQANDIEPVRAPMSGRELAAAQREDHLRALEEERAGLKAAGKDDRVKQVDAEIARVKGEPKGRTAPDTGTGSSGRVKQSDVPDGDIADVLNWVGEDAARAKVALTVENKKDADDRRSTLVEKLEKIAG
ncbi:hypothetical protein GCM10009795_040040 [Nocardioides hankookensis]|uniref:Scaffolding protein n=1 Tax=Nocardioides hankookensis TaxID=443157 RepID=A0ABW1LQR5_9ACTN